MVDARRLQNRYRLDERIASGGMGAVYTAHDERLGRKVAVKLLKDDLAHDVRFVERFRREARAVAALGHPNIANVFDYGEDDDKPFIVMELAEGSDLARLLREEGAFQPERAADVAAQVCAALGHAHAAGIVHRDVKPANIIVGPNDRVKVTDFGIARAVGDSTLTATGSVLGTAHYLSPEQAAGGEVGPASDLYSLGIVLYEMLTGAVPFTADTPIAIAMRHVSDPVPAPSLVNPDVPAALDDVVARATAKDTASRFGDAHEMEAALEARGSLGATATAALGAAMGAAPVATEELARTRPDAPTTVWASGWDAHRIGRMVLISLVALALVAAALLAWRVMGGDADPAARQAAPPAEETQAAEEETSEREGASSPQPDSFIIEEAIIGMQVKDVERALKEAGLTVARVDVESEAPKDTVVDTDPDPGSEVQAGDEITLYVSTGFVEEEEEEDDEGKGHGPPDGPPGKEKKNKGEGG